MIGSPFGNASWRRPRNRSSNMIAINGIVRVVPVKNQARLLLGQSEKACQNVPYITDNA